MIENLRFTEQQLSDKSVASLPDRPSEAGLTAAQLKAAFDELGKNQIALGRFNNLLDELLAKTAALSLGADKVHPLDTSAASVQAKFTMLWERIQAVVAGSGAVTSVDGVIPDAGGNVALLARNIPLDPSAFANKLTAADNDLQKLAAKVDRGNTSVSVAIRANQWQKQGETYTQLIPVAGLSESDEAILTFSLTDIKAKLLRPFLGSATRSGAILVEASSAIERDVTAMLTVVGRL